MHRTRRLRRATAAASAWNTGPRPTLMPPESVRESAPQPARVAHEPCAMGLTHRPGVSVIWATTAFTITAVVADVTRQRAVYRDANDVATILRVAVVSAMWAIPLAAHPGLPVAAFATNIAR